MGLTEVFIFGPLLISIVLLIAKWRGMKKYIPAGLFASLYANLICHISMYFNLFYYPFKPEEAIVNCIGVPVLAMYWIRYVPKRLNLVYWSLLWTLPITGIEYIAERYAQIIVYSNGYDWYYSLIQWFISWFIWYGFHLWFNNENEFALLYKRD